LSASIAFACPRCAGPAARTATELRCSPCGLEWRDAEGALDLRLAGARSPTDADPWPWTEAVARDALGALERGAPWKQVFETALLALDDERADHLMLLTREARAAWLVFLESANGRALCIGNASSGAHVALARAGFSVVLVDRSPLRLALARAQGRALGRGAPQTVCVAETERLPFLDGAFEVVLQEQGLPQARTPWASPSSELLRVATEQVQTANNRFGYKRSAGRRGDFRVPGPLEYLRGALFPPPGVRSLAGHRAHLAAAGAARVRALALYPHLADFTHVVGLDGAPPALMLGPKERRNRAKILGQRLGLFPWLTPSFALLGTRRDAEPSVRLERALEALAQRTGEPRPQLEFAQATRGNTLLALTHLPGHDPREPRGRWAVHVPLSEQQKVQLVQHHGRLGLIRERFPALPVPEPLWIGEIEGLMLACERRLPGLTAPQFTGDTRVAARMFADAARDFATLVMRPARPFDERDFERLLRARFEVAARYCAVPETARRLAELCESVRSELLGARLPLVLHHADLRSKHVQVTPEGQVLGYLDWGPSELEDLPYFDVLHLVVHERKHEAGLSAARAWAIARERTELRPHERAALDDYCARLGIEDRARRAIEAAYPVLVAAMAERNWDYSRPRWLARQFQIR
jgi:hypothetical protein